MLFNFKQYESNMYDVEEEVLSIDLEDFSIEYDCMLGTKYRNIKTGDIVDLSEIFNENKGIFINHEFRIFNNRECNISQSVLKKGIYITFEKDVIYNTFRKPEKLKKPKTIKKKIVFKVPRYLKVYDVHSYIRNIYSKFDVPMYYDDVVRKEYNKDISFFSKELGIRITRKISNIKVIFNYNSYRAWDLYGTLSVYANAIDRTYTIDFTRPIKTVFRRYINHELDPYGEDDWGDNWGID